MVTLKLVSVLTENKINKIKLILDFGQLLDEHVFFAMQSSAFITLMSKHRTVNSDANSWWNHLLYQLLAVSWA